MTDQDDSYGPDEDPTFSEQLLIVKDDAAKFGFVPSTQTFSYNSPDSGYGIALQVSEHSKSGFGWQVYDPDGMQVGGEEHFADALRLVVDDVFGGRPVTTPSMI